MPVQKNFFYALGISILSLQLAHADGVSPSWATVYKRGVRLSDGRAAIGSAVLIAPGRLVTSCHTTRQAVQIHVLHREGQLPAKADRSDIRHDVCTLSVPELRGPSAVRVPSSQLAVGQPVTALGYGTGYRIRVGEGAITALYAYDGGRVVRTSALFPRGASGGGLFDDGGRLVGVLTFRASIDEELNYAVPTEWIDRPVEDDAPASAFGPHALAFWEDEAADPPRFLRAAWLEYAQAWQALEALAVDWALQDGDNAAPWLALGRAKLELDRRREAVLAVRRAVALAPEDSRAWYWLASAYRGIGFDAEFIWASDRLAQLDPRLAGRLKDEGTALLVE